MIKYIVMEKKTKVYYVIESNKGPKELEKSLGKGYKIVRGERI